MQDTPALRGIDNHRGDSPRAGKQGNGQRYNGNAVLVFGLLGFFRCLLVAHRLRLQHRNCHQQDEDCATHFERRDGDAEEAQQGLADNRRRDQDDGDSHARHPCDAHLLPLAQISAHHDKGWNCAERIDDHQQGDKYFQVITPGEHFRAHQAIRSMIVAVAMP